MSKNNKIFKMNECHEHAECINSKGTYECLCKKGRCHRFSVNGAEEFVSASRIDM